MRHRIPEFIPADKGLGSRTKLTTRTRSTTPVPPRNGKQYAKNPINDNDTDERRRDVYFLRQLISLYPGTVFRRWNLDAGRLNRLWCDDILIVCGTHTDTDASAEFRIDMSRAEALMLRIDENG